MVEVKFNYSKKMKNIIYPIILVLLSLVSCMDKDNFDGPDSRVEGRVIDVYTGENILASQAGFTIRIWERSWDGESINYQTIPIKQDGTYKDTKLFGGTYDLLCYGGAFWANDTIKNIEISPKGATVNFEITPYLQIENFDYKVVDGGSTGQQIVMSCSMRAPRIKDLPNLYELKSFINTTPWCGNTNTIGISEYTNSRIEFNKSWGEEMESKGLSATSPTSIIYELPAMPVKSGYTYWLRVGVAVNDANRNYNYSEIVKVEIP